MSKRMPVMGFENVADDNLRGYGKVSLAPGFPVFEAGSALKQTTSAISGILGVLVISGCASVGSLAGYGAPSMGVDNSLFTASSGAAVEEQLDQAMPGTLQNNSVANVSSGPYLPPGNIGGASVGIPVATAPVASSRLPPPVPNSSTVPGAVPSTPSQSIFVGSQQAMPAQTQPAVSPARVTEPFQDNSVPRIASGERSPTLSVVPNEGYVHTVESGESLYAIARRYNVKTDDIVRANGLNSADQIFVGQKIIIPGREDLVASAPASAASSSVAPVRVAEKPEAVPEKPVRVATVAPANATPDQSAAVSRVEGFRWPVNGRVIVDFEQSRRTGINIEAPEGSAVRAAEDGTVIYVGNEIEGFGNLILVRHANGYVSAYAHLKEFSITNNAQVRRGDKIGTVGMTGSVNRPQLHFELRQGATPVDPMPLLAT